VHWPSALRHGLAFIALYVILDWVSFIHEFSPLGFTPWNPPPGLTIAFLLSTHPINAIWLMPAALLADLFVRGMPAPLTASLLSAAALGAGYGGIALLARRLTVFDPDLRQVRDVLILLGIGLVASSVVALVNTGIFALFGLLAAADLPVAAFRHWVGDFIGIAVLTPFLLVLRRSQLQMTGSVLAETAAVAASIVLLLWVVFGIPQTDDFNVFYLQLMPVLWGAMRYGLVGAVGAILFTQLGLIVAIELLGYATTTLVEFQLLMVVLCVTGLLIGVVVSERQEVRLALGDSERRLRQRQDEIAQFGRASALGEMASSLVHEISQPLSALTTYIDACHRLLKKPSVNLPRALSNIAKAHAQAERAGRVLEGLRDFLYRGETHLEPLSLTALFDSVRKLSEPEAIRLGVEVWLRDRTGSAEILVDRIQIEQVLLNLLRNSLEALSEAGSPNPRVDISAALEGSLVEISVDDNGPGVPADIVDRLFEPFVTTKSRGMGLGLTISRSIVEAHGGRLACTRRADNGCSFTITLPTTGGA
jgi:two-component system sensor kinase FixL